MPPRRTTSLHTPHDAATPLTTWSGEDLDDAGGTASELSFSISQERHPVALRVAAQPLLPVPQTALGVVEGVVDRGVRILEERLAGGGSRDRDLVTARDGHINRHPIPLAVAMVPVIQVHDDMAMHDATEKAVQLSRPTRHMSQESCRMWHSSECALQR